MQLLLTLKNADRVYIYNIFVTLKSHSFQHMNRD